ncbi:MAG: hydrogenase formation protein HypD [Candidatus Omnitrophota bacterium]
MKFVDEFRNQNLVRALACRINEITSKDKTINLMEVCGTHTQGFFRFGLKELLPKNIRLISGPGCPVCVSSQDYLDHAVALAKIPGVIITTFGDMLRVPGSSSALEKERAKGADVRVVYSTLDSLKIAAQNPDKKIVFLGVGFETTAPTIALAILQAKKKGLNNFSVLASHKLIVPAMEEICKDPHLNIHGFLCPGHVSVIIGSRPYEIISRRYRVPCVIAGFEPLDILEGIYMLLRMIKEKKSAVKIQYKRVVTPAGNLRAKAVLRRVFSVADSSWRGLGIIPKSGLKINPAFARFDAGKIFKLKDLDASPPKGCWCGLILKGVKVPPDCPNFSRRCTPENPLGPCMVATEGACSVYYRYRK